MEELKQWLLDKGYQVSQDAEDKQTLTAISQVTGTVIKVWFKEGDTQSQIE